MVSRGFDCTRFEYDDWPRETGAGASETVPNHRASREAPAGDFGGGRGSHARRANDDDDRTRSEYSHLPRRHLLRATITLLVPSSSSRWTTSAPANSGEPEAIPISGPG